MDKKGDKEYIQKGREYVIVFAIYLRRYFKGLYHRRIEEKLPLCFSLKHCGGSRCGPNVPSLQNSDSMH